MKYILFSTFAIWASLFGVIHGILFSGKASKAFPWNEHIIFVIFILVTAGMVAMGYNMGLEADPFISMVYLLAACTLAYSFLHNGAYYETRQRIDVPAYNYFSNSSTSTAVLEMPLYVRLPLFIIGVIILFL